MVCISSAPTVDLFLEIPVPMSHGGWAWGPHPRFPGPLGSDYAYNGREICSLVRAYSVTVTRLLRPAEAPRFIVYGRGRVTGMVTSRDEWVWSPGRHTYRPTSEQPWDESRAAIRRYFELTGVIFTRQKFRANISGSSTLLPHPPPLRLVRDPAA